MKAPLMYPPGLPKDVKLALMRGNRQIDTLIREKMQQLDPETHKRVSFGLRGARTIQGLIVENLFTA